MRDGARLAGIAAVIAAAMLWGTTGTLQAALPPDRQPLVVGALRLAIGALALLALALSAPATRAAFRGLPPGGVLFAGLAIGAYNLLFFLAVLRAGVGVGTAIAIGSAPVWVTAWEVAATRRLPRGRRAAGQALSIAGAGLLVATGDTGDALAGGALLAALAGAAYAAYSLATSRIGHRAPPATLAAATFGVAALATLPVLALAPTAWLAAPEVWPVLAFLGVGATALAYALYTWGLRRLAASTAVTLALAEPLTAWVLATLVVGEPATLPRLAGAALLLAGLAMVTLSPAAPAAAARSRPDPTRPPPISG
ncbi:EamA family transporter [Rhodobacteraceae bacterium 2CG4]|uniref:EamA family transporter n=1 Tax=Halovulum marinum TaxID=2662447 RepID=A0A6L5YXJ4_9RHOB|nr:EamA family transporter [Halovulum marinum]MSU89051.1 EamA family transporter [Halovulum marinum]